MWVIDLENPPERLRGTLSRWGVEVRAGLYVGSSTGKVRDQIWELVVTSCRPETSAVLVFDSRGPQGFEVRTHGPNRREIVDVEGLWLARFGPKQGDAAEPDEVPEEALRFDPAEIEAGYLEP